MKNKKEAISICPKELEPIFKAVNKLPEDLERFESDLSELSEKFNKEHLQIIQNHGNRTIYGYDPLEKDWLKLSKKYDWKLRQIITPELANLIKVTVDRNGFQNVRFRLRRLVNEKKTLRDIVRAYRIWDIGYNRQPYGTHAALFNSDTEDYSHEKKLLLQLKPTFNLSKALSAFGFNEDTSLELLSFHVLEILTRNQFPIERIKICPICKNIFWAKRTDSSACSDNHVNTFNQSKTRIRKRINELNKKLEDESKELETIREKLEKLQNYKLPIPALVAAQENLFNEQMKKLDKLNNKLHATQLRYGELLNI